MILNSIVNKTAGKTKLFFDISYLLPGSPRRQAIDETSVDGGYIKVQSIFLWLFSTCNFFILLLKVLGLIHGNPAAGNTMPESRDFNVLLTTHSFPVTIIFRDHDIVDSVGTLHRFWFYGSASVYINVLKNAGHNSRIDAPDLFQQYLREALAR